MCFADQGEDPASSINIKKEDISQMKCASKHSALRYGVRQGSEVFPENQGTSRSMEGKTRPWRQGESGLPPTTTGNMKR